MSVLVPRAAPKVWSAHAWQTGCFIAPFLRRAEIIAGGVDGTVRRFDVRMGMEVSDALGAPVTCVAVSHDGNCLLAACTDGALRLLDKQVMLERTAACAV